MSTRMPVRILTAMPNDANPDGDIFGGWLMSQMDLAAGAICKRRAGGRVVTVAVEGFKFLAPVHIGDEVVIYAEIVKTGTTSLTSKVCTYTRDGCTGDETKVCEAVYVFVHVGADLKPTPIPQDEVSEAVGLNGEMTEIARKAYQFIRSGGNDGTGRPMTHPAQEALVAEVGRLIGYLIDEAKN